jgi:glycosyltransferase involved in cell wall biosynthesis
MTGSSVSVVMAVRNGAEYVRTALESLFGQTRPADEVILVDDGSEDDLDGALRPFRAQLLVLRNDQALGVSAARNRGIARAGSEWIAFLDQDDEWHRDYLERQLAAVADRPEVGLVYCDVEIFGAKSISSRLRAQHWPRSSRPYPPRGRVFGDLLIGPCFAIPSATLVRRQAVIEAGGFDETLVPGGCEDRDLWLRVAAAWEVECVPAVLARWRMHDRNASRLTKGMLMNTFVVLHRARHYAPHSYRALWPWISRRLGGTCLELGRLHMLEGNTSSARRWLARSLLYRGHRLRAGAHLGLSFLPPRALAWLRTAVREVRVLWGG